MLARRDNALKIIFFFLDLYLIFSLNRYRYCDALISLRFKYNINVITSEACLYISIIVE